MVAPGARAPDTGLSDSRVAVVFVNYHSEDLIQPLGRLYEAAGLKVVVVDNSGTYPADAAGLCVSAPTNIGFGSACNLGVDLLAGSVSVVCLHNPDVDPCLATIRAGAALLQTQSRPGILAPAEVVGGLTRQNGYRYPSPHREVFLGLSAGHRAHRTERVLRGRGRRFAGAGLLLVSTGAWHAIGGFDPTFFMYAEDLDLWHRMARAGFGCQFAPHLTFRHHMGKGSPAAPADREILRWLGVELFAAKHSASGWRPYRAIHRRCLPRVAGEGSSLAGAVRAAWDDGLDPVATLEEVRPRPAVDTAAGRPT